MSNRNLEHIRTTRLKLLVRRDKLRSILLLVVAAAVIVATLVIPGPPRPTAYRPSSTAKQSLRKIQKLAAVLPAGTTTLPRLAASGSCTQGTTLNIVAHQDDDILFMNPAIADAIAAGECIRTVYVTAGDDGRSSAYWLEREAGSKAAYALMAGVADEWVASEPLISNHQLAAYSLAARPTISLLFMHLPDGSLDGSGFTGDQGQSLHKLLGAQVPSLRTVDGMATYTETDLLTNFGALMQLDKPQTVNTQAFGAELAGGDHSDHQSVGYLTTRALHMYYPQTKLTRYIGYQSKGRDANLSIEETIRKTKIFDTYRIYDQNICDDTGECHGASTYTDFLSRQYVYDGPATVAGSSR